MGALDDCDIFCVVQSDHDVVRVKRVGHVGEGGCGGCWGGPEVRVRVIANLMSALSVALYTL